MKIEFSDTETIVLLVVAIVFMIIMSFKCDKPISSNKVTQDSLYYKDYEYDYSYDLDTIYEIYGNDTVKYYDHE